MKTGRVDGLKVKGSIVVDQHYQCPSCRLAKAKKGKTPHSTEFPQPVNYVGHVISTDVKSVPFISYRGYKYAVVFVDHYCRKGWVYFMRKLDEVSSKLIIFLDDLKKLDVKVKKIQHDRGSTYFSQEGPSRYNEGRSKHEFTTICEKNHIHQLIQPVEMKEKLAEQWILYHFNAGSTMLLEARLSPAFWPDAVAYSNYCFDRVKRLLVMLFVGEIVMLFVGEPVMLFVKEVVILLVLQPTLGLGEMMMIKSPRLSMQLTRVHFPQQVLMLRKRD